MGRRSLGQQFPEASENWGVAKLVKAPDFDSGMRRFESFLPSQVQPQLPRGGRRGCFVSAVGMKVAVPRAAGGRSHGL